MSTEQLTALFELIHTVFPLTEAQMGVKFQGTHSLTLKPPHGVCLGVWWRGRSWNTVFEPGDCIDEKTLRSIRAEIERAAP
jgi:hypothetical protein